jgi:hypothetical protein
MVAIVVPRCVDGLAPKSEVARAEMVRLSRQTIALHNDIINQAGEGARPV